MISIQKALKIIQTNVPTLSKETVLLSKSINRIVAEDIQAPEPSPRYTNSAMDGFAVRWDDVETVKEGKSVLLPIIGESCAGVPFSGIVPPGKAVRINTGAMLPEGADTVIPVEDVEEAEQSIRILRVGKKHQHVRFRGEEFDIGTVVLEKGSRITPAGVGLLAALGIARVPVFQKPKIAVLVTGSELVSADTEAAPWQIRDSNGSMLRAAVEYSNGEVTTVLRCKDDLESIREKIRECSEIAQIIIISGGVSVGPHDLVKEAASQEGFQALFWRVNQKPGKPLYFAKKNGTLLFGLPGNPVSALNCFAYYVHPIVLRMQGGEFSWQTITGQLVEPAVNKGERNVFLRVQVRRDENHRVEVLPLAGQGSHMLTSLTQADGFLLLKPHQRIAIGEVVQVFLYPWSRK